MPSKKILITAPSLDEQENVSGVASVVREIISSLSNQYSFIHLRVGSAQSTPQVHSRLRWLRQTCEAVWTVLFHSYVALHSNTALNPKSIIRDSLLMIIASARRKSVLWHVHGGSMMTAAPDKVTRAVISQLFRIPSTIVVLSSLERSYLSETFGVRIGKISVIKNGTSIGQRAPVALKGPRLKVIYAGRLVKEKGLDILIEFMTTSHVSNSIDLHIFGSGPLLPLVLSNASPRITYNGTVSQKRIREVLRDFDIVVLPSRNGEGMPMVIVEAMAEGVVPVCTSMASIPEIVEHEVTGFLIQPSVRSLEEAFESFVDGKLKVTTLSSAAYQFATRELDASKNFQALGAIYG